jgi:8-oxo-dGTP pyrophosphatase MutT (NUDIX family)
MTVRAAQTRVAETIWKPNTTVAAVCERDGRYLLVRERVGRREVYNQPAGHLEAGETLLQAVVRETLEETRFRFTPTALQGVYRYRPSESKDRTYLRFLFRGEVGERLEGDLDEGIIAVEWLSYDEIVDCRAQHRSPMVLQCIDDYRRGPGFPLDVISEDFA